MARRSLVPTLDLLNPFLPWLYNTISHHNLFSAAMQNNKSDVVAHDNESQEGVSEKRGTDGDQRDMYRMGKQQELRRNFRFVSIFGYSMVLMATWETILTYVCRFVGVYS
jgi:hypothetical protein